MKEATGEATNTVVTIILIGAVLTMGGVIINAVMKKINSNADKVGDSDVPTDLDYTYNIEQQVF